MRLQCGPEYFVSLHRFIGRCASEAFAKSACSLREIGGEHLLKRIGKAGFEYPARNRFECAGETYINAGPLLLAVSIELPKRFRLFRREAHAAVRAALLWAGRPYPPDKWLASETPEPLREPVRALVDQSRNAADRLDALEELRRLVEEPVPVERLGDWYLLV